MVKKVVLILLVLLCAGCVNVSISEYNSKQGSDGSFLKITRNIEDPLLGSTTLVWAMKDTEQCGGVVDVEKSSRFMVIDDINPLVADFREEGVFVDTDSALILRLHTVAGKSYECAIVVQFTPEKGKDYEIRLLGKVNAFPHRCRAELWSTIKGAGVSKKEEFDFYNDC